LVADFLPEYIATLLDDDALAGVPCLDPFFDTDFEAALDTDLEAALLTSSLNVLFYLDKVFFVSSLAALLPLMAIFLGF